MLEFSKIYHIMIALLLKTKIVFCIGFTIGIIFAVLLMLAQNLIYDEEMCKSVQLLGLLSNGQCYKDNDSVYRRQFKNQEKLVDHSQKDGYRSAYQNWLRRQNVKISRANTVLDEYDPEFNLNMKNHLVRESVWLRSIIRVTCVVFVEKVKLAESVHGTWASRCNDIYYFGNDKKHSAIPIIDIGLKMTSSWQILCEAVNHICKKSLNSTQCRPTEPEGIMRWFIFVKDDMLVIPENLRYLVAALNSKDDYYLGHAVVLWGQEYNTAQAGYVLSRGAMQKVVEMFNTTEKCSTGGRFWKKEDYYLGKHLASLGIHPMDTRDEDLSDTFHGYSLEIMLWGVAKVGNYWTHALYPPGPYCCSTKSVTFSVGDPDKMYMLYYMLYRLHSRHSNEVHRNQPPATDVSDQEIWKSILKDEFNITDLNDISSQRYYEIWRERYSEPEEFIMNNYKNMPDVLSSMLTVYESEKKLEKTTAPLL